MEDRRSVHAALRLFDVLDDIGDDGAGDGAALEDHVDAVHGALSAAVESYCGFELTLVRGETPLTLTSTTVPAPGPADQPGLATAAEPGDRRVVRSSLRLPLSVEGSGFQAGSRLVVYASRAGAWVDLAADVDHLLRPADGTEPTDGRTVAALTIGAPVVDADVPVELLPGVEGLDVLVAVERAKGMLIERGHHPDDVDDAFTRQATAAGLTPYAFALGIERRRRAERRDAGSSTAEGEDD
jgi:hypothetical protein